MLSNLSLASEDADSPESILTCPSGSFSDGSRIRPFDSRYSPDKPTLTKQLHSRGAQSSPASLSGSLTDIPVLLVNGAPQPELHIKSPGPEFDLIQMMTASSPKPCSPHSESHVSLQSVLLAATTLKMVDHTDVFLWLFRFPSPV